MRTRGVKFKLSLIYTIAILVSACAPSAPSKGTLLNPIPAPDFHLEDQDGKSVSLADYRGKVITLTFLYTHCPDECPLIADHLRAAAEQLGDVTKQTAFIAISVDPDNDTPAAIRQFDQEHHLNGQLRYLNGAREQLQFVLKAYYLYTRVEPLNPSLVAHTTRVVVIDKKGNQRINLDKDFDPKDLANNIRALAAE
jgi:protein SCO1